MKTWLAEGRVGANSLVWRAGWPEWRSAADVFPQLAVPTVALPAADDLDVSPDELPFGMNTDGRPGMSVDAGALGMRRRRKPRSNNVTVIASIVLVAVAIVLIVVLIVVLQNQGNSTAQLPAALRQLA
jgi:hypothetical protein